MKKTQRASQRVRRAILTMQGIYRTQDVVEHIEKIEPGLLEHHFQNPMQGISTTLCEMAKASAIWTMRSQHGKSRNVWGINVPMQPVQIPTKPMLEEPAAGPVSPVCIQETSEEDRLAAIEAKLDLILAAVKVQ